MFFRKKKKEPPKTKASTSPKPPVHFDKEKPEAVICCMTCREPLWTMEVRQVQGKVLSTTTLPFGRNKQYFNDRLTDCPLCHRPFMKEEGADKKVLLRSLATGAFFTV